MRPPSPFGCINVCVELQNRVNFNSRVCLFIVEVLVTDLKWNLGLVFGSCATVWRPRYDCTNYC